MVYIIYNDYIYINDYIGYIAYGKHMNDIDLSKACLTASSIIVLMVVDVNGHWKLPIAYYFINSLSSMERANIVNDTLISLHETGVLVTSITDRPRNHFAMVTQLCAKLNIDDDLQVYFLHPISKEKFLYFWIKVYICTLEFPC